MKFSDKALLDRIEAQFIGPLPDGKATLSDLIAYAQLRALERLADNVFNLEQTLAVIRADFVRWAPGAEEFPL